MVPAAFWQEAEDWHTAGEPFRIVQKLPSGSLDGNLTVSEQRIRILETHDHPLDVLRRSLCHEPIGHADMYGGYILQPDDTGAHFGVLFWHKDGFSTACGHGTIALGYWALAKGIVSPKSRTGTVDVVIDVPSGRVVARAQLTEGVVQHVDFVNIPSYSLSRDIPISLQVASQTFQLKMDLSFGGAVYASVSARGLGLRITPENHQQFIDLQRQLKRQLSGFKYQDVYDLYGVCFFEDVDEDDKSITQKNVVVFADGQIDRSPCGSGTCARVAALLAEGRLSGTKELVHRSIIGTEFIATIYNKAASPTEFPACIPLVRGQAHLVARHDFWIDREDPVFPGFVFR